MNYVTIPLINLLGAGFLVIVAVALSRRQNLGLERDLGIGALRAAAQLIAIGYALVLIFQNDHPALVVLILGVMLTVASLTASRRVSHGPGPAALMPLAAASIGAANLVALVPVLIWIVPVRPLLTARYFIPIGGMMLAAAMNTVSLVFERMLTTSFQQATVIEQALALGASPGDSVAFVRSQALRAAMIPTINGLLTVGLVQLPGMMTGQIVSGTSPVQAVRYQLVVMYQLVAVASVSGALAAFLLQRAMFDSRGCLRKWER